MRYRITHTTTYAYEELVSICHNEAHLTPRSTRTQRCAHSRLDIEPTPAVFAPETDYFGNATRFFAVQEPHQRMIVRARSELEVSDSARPAPEGVPPWEIVRARLQRDRSRPALGAFEMTLESPLLRARDVALQEPGPQRGDLHDALAAYAAASFPARRPLLDGALDLTHRIHADFAYRPGATSVRTPLAQVYAAREGVCQDFAHIAIACLRALGLAARYVSGYLRTDPPPDRPALIGADQSHAWLAVWCGDAGWIDLDPTSDGLAAERHLTLGWGRDYGDVAPIKGVILGGREHTVKVSVHLEPAPTPATSGETENGA